MKWLLLILLVSCVVPTEEKPKEVEVIDKPVPFVGRWSNPEYDAILSNALDVYGKDLLVTEPTDCATFYCLKDEKKFWFNTIINMAYYESSWKTSTQYKENFKDQKGNYIVSRGLLQISIESGKGYDCPLKTEQDLHDPKINLECGVRILNRWVSRDKRIAGHAGGKWLGGARYWSVLRNPDGAPKKSYDYIRNYHKGIIE